MAGAGLTAHGLGEKVLFLPHNFAGGIEAVAIMNSQIDQLTQRLTNTGQNLIGGMASCLMPFQNSAKELAVGKVALVLQEGLDGRISPDRTWARSSQLNQGFE